MGVTLQPLQSCRIASTPAPVISSPGLPPFLVVLDTNVVLDLFYFRDSRCAALLEALSHGRCRWVATSAMRDEIEHVLQRGLSGDWPGDAATVDAAWARWAAPVQPDGQPSLPHMRCTDPDDQKFVDLALQVGAQALLSADRAVLRLARRAREHGLEIATVDQWTARTQKP